MQQVVSPRLSKHLVFVLFEDFELLDVAGPLEVFSKVDGWEVTLLSPDGRPVGSSQGVRFEVSGDYAPQSSDVLFVPGGRGTRKLAHDESFLNALKSLASDTSVVMSVCTGSALLAAAGLLEGYAATSNKRAFAWATSFGQDIDWRRSARWVHDRDRWTSSGVSAGTDMAAAFVADECCEAVAREVADAIELRLHLDPNEDPFAI